MSIASDDVGRKVGRSSGWLGLVVSRSWRRTRRCLVPCLVPQQLLLSYSSALVSLRSSFSPLTSFT